MREREKEKGAEGKGGWRATEVFKKNDREDECHSC